MYYKGIVVFFLSTALVLGVVVVLNLEATTVGNQIQALPTLKASCAPGDPACPRFSIVSASLRSQNTTDQLGVANPAYLSLVLNVSGATQLASIRLFIGNASAGTVRGPFGSGYSRIVNLTLPATVSISPGKSYLLSVQGLSDNGAYVIKTSLVTAESRVPYSP